MIAPALSLPTQTLQESFVAPRDFLALAGSWSKAEPFSHVVIDDFLTPQTLDAVISEFPEFSAPVWYQYDNAIEIKKAMNSWDRMGPMTYRLFHYLNSRAFVAQLELLTGCTLYADFGLNGGGLHTHRAGGKLNAHLDYSIHPKLGLERRLNLLIYITPGWREEWGGHLGLWRQQKEKRAPGELVKQILPRFNRAMLFDTTQNSWHGLPEPVGCPQDVTRNSLAVYYLCEPRPNADPRGRALYAPHKGQENDPHVLELIAKRASVAGSADVYRKR